MAVGRSSLGGAGLPALGEAGGASSRPELRSARPEPDRRGPRPYAAAVVTGSEVRKAAAVCTTFLAGTTSAAWSTDVPEMEMSVAGAVAHAAESCLWYAIDLAAAGDDLQPVEHRVKPDSDPVALVATLAAYAAVAAAVIDATPSTVRGFHPMGRADPSGFAAMACDEMLIHTDDAARGLGLGFTPPRALADAVLRRLFPWAPAGGDPWELLRWANGRVALPDRPRLVGWAWHCAPPEEWNGERAVSPRLRPSALPDQPEPPA